MTKRLKAAIIGYHRMGATPCQILEIINDLKDFKYWYEKHKVEKVIYDYKLKFLNN